MVSYVPVVIVPRADGSVHYANGNGSNGHHGISSLMVDGVAVPLKPKLGRAVLPTDIDTAPGGLERTLTVAAADRLVMKGFSPQAVSAYLPVKRRTPFMLETNERYAVD